VAERRITSATASRGTARHGIGVGGNKVLGICTTFDFPNTDQGLYGAQLQRIALAGGRGTSPN